MNPEILTFLPHSGKVSMPDRIEPDLWPQTPIKLSEVEQHLAGISGHERRFPHEWRGVKESKGLSKYRSKYIDRVDLDGCRVIG